ncbi:MAG TPA: T9SS type A sorting domain-containing protein [Aequorivita sp.]|nr:T9SS type A sorting domain-containing protein [Aequorivita sp.]
MKFKLLLLSIVGSIAVANAQYTVTDEVGNVLNDGDIIEYGTYGVGEGSYDFYVTNDNPSQTIYTRIEFVDAINTDGSLFELCYGLCMTGLTIGQTVPMAPETLPIGVGEATGYGNHFQNFDPGNGVDNLDYIFAFHQYEADGVTEIGTPLTFTYRYNPLLSVKDNKAVNLTLHSTIVRDELVMDVKESIHMTVYNLLGKKVKEVQLETGRQHVNMSNLSAQPYIIRFTNERGATKVEKIVVQ